MSDLLAVELPNDMFCTPVTCNIRLPSTNAGEVMQMALSVCLSDKSAFALLSPTETTPKYMYLISS